VPASPSGLTLSQRRAIGSCLLRPRLHAILGPPGTGKTTTLCELLQQVIAARRAGRDDARVLFVGHSNASVDIVVDRLMSGRAGPIPEPGTVVRWSSQTHSREATLEHMGPEAADRILAVTPGNALPGGGTSPRLPLTEELTQAVVVAATVNTASKLVGGDKAGGCPAFAFVVIDEASTVTDAESFALLCGAFAAGCEDEELLHASWHAGVRKGTIAARAKSLGVYGHLPFDKGADGPVGEPMLAAGEAACTQLWRRRAFDGLSKVARPQLESMAPTVVLCGDPKQLNPVVMSGLAEMLGHAVSPLERMTGVVKVPEEEMAMQRARPGLSSSGWRTRELATRAAGPGSGAEAAGGELRDTADDDVVWEVGASADTGAGEARGAGRRQRRRQLAEAHRARREAAAASGAGGPAPAAELDDGDDRDRGASGGTSPADDVAAATCRPEDLGARRKSGFRGRHARDPVIFEAAQSAFRDALDNPEAHTAQIAHVSEEWADDLACNASDVARLRQRWAEAAVMGDPDHRCVSLLTESFRAHPDIHRLWSVLSYGGKVHPARQHTDADAAVGDAAAAAVSAALAGMGAISLGTPDEPWGDDLRGLLRAGRELGAVAAAAGEAPWATTCRRLLQPGTGLSPELAAAAIDSWQRRARPGLPPSHCRVIVVLVPGVMHRERGETSPTNPAEADVVSAVVAAAAGSSVGVGFGDTGVCTPYWRQASYIRHRVEADHGAAASEAAKVATVNKFQGDEVRFEVISTVRASCARRGADEIVLTGGESGTEAEWASSEDSSIGFLGNPRRTNVAISRAKDLLVVVGDPAVLRQDERWSQVAVYAALTGSLWSLEPAELHRRARAAVV